MTRTPHRQRMATDARGASREPGTWAEHGERGPHDGMWDTFPRFRRASTRDHAPASNRTNGRRRCGTSRWILPASTLFVALCLVLTATIALGAVRLPLASIAK